MKLFLGFIFTFFLNLYLTNQQKCYNYTCGSLKDNQCESSISNSTDQWFILQECPHNFYCPWQSLQKSINCRTSPVNDVKAYPGGSCRLNNDCLSKSCNNQTCQGRNAGDTCGADKECVFGLGCMGGVCTALKTEGLDCNKDTECRFDLACYSKKCTKYFSLPDYTVLSDGNAFLCQSGYMLNNICMTLKNKINETLTNCDVNYPCNYTDSNSSEVAINKCECGYNQFSQTKCMLGPHSNEDFSLYMNNMRLIMTNYTAKCNAEESRFAYCAEYTRNDWNIKHLTIQIQKQKIFSESSHLLKDADSCVPKVVFGWDDTPPQPRDNRWQCPQFKCSSDYKDSCAYSINPFNEYGTNVTVYLNNICKSDEFCNYNKPNVFSNWTSSHYCSKTGSRPPVVRNKLPGEMCKAHSDCTKSSFNETIGYCIDGKCTGMSENDKCKNHADCLSGLFCNGLRCQKQQPEKSFCIDDYYCFNYLGCLNNTCTQLFSLSNGTYLSQTSANEKFCETGIQNTATKQCSSVTYKNSTPDSNGFVKCNPGDACLYTTGYLDKNGENVTLTKDCQCGYNENGQGYCPLPFTYHSNDWRGLFQTTINKYNNNCHTLMRESCQDEWTDEQYNDEKKWASRTQEAHLYYKSVSCSGTLSSSFLKFSLFVIIAIISIIFS